MGLHSVPQLVDALHRRVGGGVEADGVFGADNVVVDGAGDAHHGYAAFAELLGTPEGAVAADGHDAVQPQQLAHTGGLGLALRRAELLAAGGIENGAAAVDDAADAAGIHAVKIPVDEAGPAPADANALDAPVQSRAHHGPHRRVHARRVAAAGQHADSFHCTFCHKCFPPIEYQNVPNIPYIILRHCSTILPRMQQEVFPERLTDREARMVRQIGTRPAPPRPADGAFCPPLRHSR